MWISANVASNILNGLSVVIGFASYYLSPEETLFKYLDGRDKYRNNGYFNGY